MKLKYSVIFAQVALKFITAGDHFAFLKKKPITLGSLNQCVGDAPIQNSKRCVQALPPLSSPSFLPREEPSRRLLFPFLLSFSTKDTKSLLAGYFFLSCFFSPLRACSQAFKNNSRLLWSMKHTDNPANQSKLEANSCSRREARENALARDDCF